MRYVMTADQFDFLKQEAANNKNITSVNMLNSTDGEIDTHDVLITFHFGNGVLTFGVTKKYTLAAKIASDGFIEKHIDDIIAEVLQTEAAVNAAKTAAQPAEGAV